jgi:magnesium chelatase accessory protein
MGRALDWEIDGAGWPNRGSSKFVTAAGLRWHVQVMGRGPPILLVHGTGASAHSWRRVMPLLAQTHTVIAPDLPGHAFTQVPVDSGLTLPGMAHALSDLMNVMGVKPVIVVGHSAGAAILVRSVLDGRMHPERILSLNGALLPFRGIAGQIFKPLAKMLVLQPFVPKIFSWRAGERRAVERVLSGTGSNLDANDIDLYARLFQSPDHVAATLGMMANWDLVGLAKDIAALKPPLILIVGMRDRAIPPSDAGRIRDVLPTATILHLENLGHLAHEERPDILGDVILRYAAVANHDQS